jgi:hypothetical protein
MLPTLSTFCITSMHNVDGAPAEPATSYASGAYVPKFQRLPSGSRTAKSRDP